MSEPTPTAPLLRGANLGLLAVLCVLVAGGGFLLAVPGKRALATIEAQRLELATRLDAWVRERAGIRPATEAERAGWAAHWKHLEQRIPAVADDSALVARVAAELDAPSVRRLEVAHRTVVRPHDEDPDGEALAIELDEPFGDARMAIEPVPLRVTLRSSYADALRIVERLESATLPLRVDALELKRDRPGVAMRVDLTWFTRRTGGARAPARDGAS